MTEIEIKKVCKKFQNKLLLDALKNKFPHYSCWCVTNKFRKLVLVVIGFESINYTATKNVENVI